MADLTTKIAELFISSCPVGWSMSGGGELTRLDDIDGEPNWHMRNPDDGEGWNGGIAEAADFLSNAFPTRPGEERKPDLTQPTEFLVYEEDQIVELARLAYVAAREHGTPNWTLDLMAGGLDATNIRLMATCWREFTFEPPSFADEVERLADAITNEED